MWKWSWVWTYQHRAQKSLKQFTSPFPPRSSAWDRFWKAANSFIRTRVSFPIPIITSEPSRLKLENTQLPSGSLHFLAPRPLCISHPLYSTHCLIAFCSLPMFSYLQVSVSHSRDQFASSPAVNKWSIVRKGEEATLLMIEAMLSHLIFSLYLAHLGPCDNISIDSNKPVSANSIMAEV